MNRNDQTFLIQKIRTQYTEKEAGELEALRALDKKVKRPANVFAWTVGTLGALVMGAGMSLVMTDLGTTLSIADPLVPGTVIGVVGLVMALMTYPFYKRILTSRKQAYAADILALSDKLMKE